METEINIPFLTSDASGPRHLLIKMSRAKLEEISSEFIERAMAIEDDLVGLDKFKIIVLIVLWTHRGNVDALILDELLPDGEKRQMH